MAQPALGVLSSVVVMAIALAFVSLFDFPTFAGWVAFTMLGLIPMQIVIVVLWNANPAFVRRLTQPAKGALLILLTVAATAVITPIVFATVGGGVSPPGPIPSHFVIIVVPTAFWLAIMMGGWPFTTMMRSHLASGFAVLVAAYVVTYAIFVIFFNYDFLRGEPVYLASAPAGLFNGVMALVFYVTALAIMFVVLCFDLWPLTRFPAVMQQPVLGIVWTVVALAGAVLAMWVAVDSGGVDPMTMLTRITAPFIFGSIIVLNMLQNTLFAKMTQPLKGVANTITAMTIGLILAQLYVAIAPALTGPLPSGPPGYELEIWLANALLSVTFPFLIYHAAFLGFWPLAGSAGPTEAGVQIGE